MTEATRTAACDAAYTALMPWTQHAQSRGEIAAMVVDCVAARLDVSESIASLRRNWPVSTSRINKICLRAVVVAAANAMEEQR